MDGGHVVEGPVWEPQVSENQVFESQVFESQVLGNFLVEYFTWHLIEKLKADIPQNVWLLASNAVVKPVKFMHHPKSDTLI